jgi:hypothetical protein
MAMMVALINSKPGIHDDRRLLLAMAVVEDLVVAKDEMERVWRGCGAALDWANGRMGEWAERAQPPSPV